MIVDFVSVAFLYAKHDLAVLVYCKHELIDIEKRRNMAVKSVSQPFL
jgi:hypothetical protein